MTDAFDWFEKRLAELEAELSEVLMAARMMTWRPALPFTGRPALEIWREQNSVCAEYLAAFEQLRSQAEGEGQAPPYPERLARYLKSLEAYADRQGHGRTRFPYNGHPLWSPQTSE